MEKMFFVGISKVPYYLDAMLPQEDVGQEEGFAVYIAGTITTRNTGTQKIYPGDPVAWRVPAFHNSPRAKMTGAGVVRGQVLPYQRVAKEGGRSRITPFIYPVSKTSYRELGQHIYHTIVRRDDRGIGRIDYRALLAEKDVAGSTMQHAAALYAKTKLVELTEGIRALQQCGAVMITPPDLRAAIEAQLGNPAGNFRGAWIAAQRTLTVGATLGSVAFSGPLNHYENNSYLRLNRKSHLGPVDAETAQTRVNDATAWLSARLGVARDGTGRIRENTNWSGGVLGAVLASHNPDREEAQQFGAVVDGAAGLGPRGKSSGSRLILQHRLMNEKAGSLSFSSIVHALSTLNSRTIGVAIGTGAGADNVDLLVGHNPLAIV